MRFGLSLLLFGLVGCAGAPAPRPAALPAFVVDALQGPDALEAKLYVAEDGVIEKVVAYVGRDSVPAWVHAMADEKLGAGEAHEFEIEQYADGTRTYEVTRLIDGRKAEMSVTVDKALRYTEVELAPEAVPAPVKAAADGMAGVSVQRIERKQGPGVDHFEIVGKEGEREVRIELDAAGMVLTKARRLPAVVQMTVR